MKDQIWLTNVKYLRCQPELFMGFSILYRYTCDTISKDTGINKEKETCQPSKESIMGHRCERTNMGAKCEIFINCSKNVKGICYGHW